MNYLELIVILSTALMIGFGHCIGMCGGIVVAYSTSKVDTASSFSRQTISHLAYNFGRVTTYTIFGVIFGLLGKAFTFSLATRGFLFIATGILMILTGFAIAGGVKFLNTSSWSLSKQSWFKSMFLKLLQSKSLSSFYFLGILNGLLPCGPVYAFAIVAASTASPLYGAIVMFVFGIGTIPGLLFLASLSNFLQRGNLRTTIVKIGAFMIMIYGAWTIFKGYKFINNPEMISKKIENMQKGYHIPEIIKNIQ
ncbi:MAG: beta-carotene 15,15'-monooxygenase [Sulfurovum sp. AS07-7]|nr:MAG: beta-carotene 15,15'-monooxygenase [Sulfurovum sp. AS07-7]